MKAVLCKQFGSPDSLVLEEVEAPRAGRGQLLIDVKTCAVSFPDTLLIQGKYQFKPPMPFSPGGEIAGVVKAVGEGVEGFQVGDQVIAFTVSGGFAEEMVVDATKTIRLPEGADYTRACTLIMTYATSHYALKERARLRPGEKLLVLGASGGVGLAAVEIGKIMGAHVIAAASSDEKLAVCKQFGADELINYSTQDLKERVKELTNGNGVDVIVDPVGGHYSEAALRGMAWEGRLLVIGFTAGEIPRIPLNLALLKGCSIVGVFWGAFAVREPERNRENVGELLTWLVEGKLRPHVSATYPLAQAGKALEEMMARKVVGKVVIMVEE